MSHLTPIFAAIDKALETSDKPFAAFDFDGTCFWDNDIEEVIQYHLCEEGLLRDDTLFTPEGEMMDEDYHRRAFLHYHELIAEGRHLESYTFTKQFFVGFTYEELKQLTREALETKHKDKWETVDLFGKQVRRGLRMHPVAQSLLNYCEEKGIAINVISASVTPVLEVGMEYLLNKKCVQSFGVDIKTDSDHKIINEYEEPNPMFGGKVKVIQHYLDPQIKPIFAIGDSLGDEKMLEYSDIKVVIDHGNSVAERAKREGWFLVPNL